MERAVAGGDDVSTGATRGVSGAGHTATSGKDLAIAHGVGEVGLATFNGSH